MLGRICAQCGVRNAVAWGIKMGQNTRCIMMYFIILGALITSASLDTNAIPCPSWKMFPTAVAMSAQAKQLK